VEENNQLNGTVIMENGDTLLLGDLTAGSVSKTSLETNEYRLLIVDKIMAL